MVKWKERCMAIAAVCLVAAGSAQAQSQQARLVCTQDGQKVIFMSKSAEISVFTSRRSDLTLVDTQSLPEHGLIIYRFKPDDITCVAVTK